jgi:cytochrome c peroxidase
MKKRIAVVIFLSVIAIAFKTGEHTNITIPKGWPKPNYDFKIKPLKHSTIELGRALFYDPILSRNNTISCASCHSPYNAFTHVDHALSHGIEDKIGTRNSPALMNLAWNKLFMWDGAVNNIEVQALAPMHNKVEMDETIEHVVTKLQASKIYPPLFRKAFGDSVITGEHTLKAIGQFMLTLVSANAKYDSVMRHQSKFTMQEENGYRLFKMHCSSCHTEPLFTNLSFENNGLPVDTNLNDFGRIRISHHYNDSLKFKVPTLRNIEFSYPYMHDGRFKTLTAVLKHYTSGIQKSNTLSPKLEQPIVLSANEQVDLTAFLLTLSDKSFLFNPNFAYPKHILLP